MSIAHAASSLCTECVGCHGRVVVTGRRRDLEWSAVLAQVNAAVGCLARMPLPHGRLRPIQATPAPPSRPRSSRSGAQGHNKAAPPGMRMPMTRDK